MGRKNMCNSKNCTHGEHKHVEVKYNDNGEATNLTPVGLDGKKIVKLALNYTPLIVVKGVTGAGKTTYVRDLINSEFVLTTVFYVNTDKKEGFEGLGSNVDPMFYDEINELEPTDSLQEVVVLDEYSNLVQNRIGVQEKVNELLVMGYQVVLVVNETSDVNLAELTHKYLEVTVNHKQVKGVISTIKEVVGESEYELYKSTLLNVN